MATPLKVKMVQNDTGPALMFDIMNDDAVCDPLSGAIITPATPYPLTGCTVKLKIRDTSTDTTTNTPHNTCTNLTLPTNRCQYTFLAGDIPNAAKYLCDLEITDAAGKVQTEYDYVEIIARAEIN